MSDRIVQKAEWVISEKELLETIRQFLESEDYNRLKQTMHRISLDESLQVSRQSANAA